MGEEVNAGRREAQPMSVKTNATVPVGVDEPGAGSPRLPGYWPVELAPPDVLAGVSTVTVAGAEARPWESMTNTA
jgi:hypothetical protein